MAHITDHTIAARPRSLRIGRVLRGAALVVALAYLLGISWYLLSHGGWPTPDYLIPPLLLLAIALGRGWSFVLDWGPFLLLVLSWQATAGIADELGRPVHVEQPAEFDFYLFGGRLPTVELQQRFFDPTEARWYDWLATLQHSMHFVLPVLVGLAIWLVSRRLYWRYLIAVMVLFYIGFAIYALYPAAPPWMAGVQGITPPVDRVAIATVRHLPTAAPIGLAYTHFNPNEVAAVPSLHAALPMLIALILIRFLGVRALPALLYPLLMGVSLVYLGEHYVFDVLAGYAVALIAFVLVWVLPDALPLRAPSRRLWPRFSIPTPVVWASNLALPVLAVASILVISFSLRPNRPADVTGPVIPGLQVQAGQSDVASVVPCGEGAAGSIQVDPRLSEVAESFAVYLFNLDDDGCYVLSASELFPPPRAMRLDVLTARAPVPLTELRRPEGTIGYYALQTGAPTPALVDAGLAAEHRYLVVVWMTGSITSPEAAAAAVGEVVAGAVVAD
ncbi:MAG: phosphatase PAP2 family protein [Dehalococcoidia bacterium]